MVHEEIKMIQEAGTPALLCFKPEELPTDCRITSFINMKIRVKAKPPFLCLKPGFDLAFGKVLLTGVGTAPSSETDMYFQYKKLSLLKEVEKCLKK